MSPWWNISVLILLSLIEIVCNVLRKIAVNSLGLILCPFRVIITLQGNTFGFKFDMYFGSFGLSTKAVLRGTLYLKKGTEINSFKPV